MIAGVTTVLCLLALTAACTARDSWHDGSSPHHHTAVPGRHRHGATIANYTGYSVIGIYLKNDQSDLIRSFYGQEGFDIWADGTRINREIDIMVSPEKKRSFLDFLIRNNITYTVLISNVQETLNREKPSVTQRREGGLFSQYNRYGEVARYLRSLARRRPRLVRVRSLGRTHEGRDILVAQVSAAHGEGRPIVLLDAGVHAREWIAPAAALCVLHKLADVPGHAADLLRVLDWHVVPLLNPDGYEHSHTKSRFWRKNRSKHSGSSCRGSDINRNFDIHWNEVGASSSPCSSQYPGTTPFSELESRALRDYALKYKSRIKLYLSLHSYGSYMLYPWGYTSRLPDDWKLLQSVAEKAVKAQLKAGGKPYVVGSSTNALYPAAGGSDDWMKAECGVNLSYTVELPGGGKLGFDMPPEHIEDTVTHFFESIRAFGNEVERLLSEGLLPD